MNKNHFGMALTARSAAVVLAASVAFAGAPQLAYAVSSSELQAQLDSARAELTKLSAQTDKSAEALTKTTESINGLQEDIDQTNTDIANTKKELGQRQEELSAIIVDNYKHPTSFLSIITGAHGYSQLVSRVHYANVVANKQQDVIDGVRTTQQNLEDQQNDLKKQKAELEKLADSQKKQTQSYQAAQNKQQAYVNSLETDVREALEAEEAARKEAERKEAERLAAQQAAEDEQREQQQASAAQQSQAQGQQQKQTQEQQGPATPAQESSTSHAEGSASSSSQEESTSSSKEESGGQHSVASSSSSVKRAAVAAAMTQLGKAYSYTPSAANPGSSFNCSGLVWWAYEQAGVSIPHGQRRGMFPSVYKSGTWTSDPSQLAVGDLVFYGSPYSTNHVGMYIGGGQIIHASYSGVEIRNVKYSGSFIGGGSIL